MVVFKSKWLIWLLSQELKLLMLMCRMLLQLFLHQHPVLLLDICYYFIYWFSFSFLLFLMATESRSILRCLMYRRCTCTTNIPKQKAWKKVDTYVEMLKTNALPLTHRNWFHWLDKTSEPLKDPVLKMPIWLIIKGDTLKMSIWDWLWIQKTIFLEICFFIITRILFFTITIVTLVNHRS